MGIMQEIAPTRGGGAGARHRDRSRRSRPADLSASRRRWRRPILQSIPPQAEALSKLNAQYQALYRTEDFKEGRRAEAEDRPPVYLGR